MLGIISAMWLFFFNSIEKALNLIEGLDLSFPFKLLTKQECFYMLVHIWKNFYKLHLSSERAAVYWFQKTRKCKMKCLDTLRGLCAFSVLNDKYLYEYFTTKEKKSS